MSATAAAAAAAALAASTEAARPLALAPPPLPLLSALAPSSSQDAAELELGAVAAEILVQPEIGHLLDGLLLLVDDECRGCHPRAPSAVSVLAAGEVPTEDTKEHAGGVILLITVRRPSLRGGVMSICGNCPSVPCPLLSQDNIPEAFYIDPPLLHFLFVLKYVVVL